MDLTKCSNYKHSNRTGKGGKMTELKFRYRLKECKTGRIFSRAFSIIDIENRAFTPNPFGSWDYEILSRDLFTGLHDKNGKEIWEGDILKHDNPNFGYGEPVPEYLYSPLRELSYLYGDDCWIGICQMGEVIGNIYENPELIKQ